MDVEIEAAPQLVQTVAEAFPDCMTALHPDDSATFSFRYPQGAWLVRFLLSFGPGLIVRKPDSVRTALLNAATKIVEINGTP